jgi:hypothetical protein
MTVTCVEALSQTSAEDRLRISTGGTPHCAVSTPEPARSERLSRCVSKRTTSSVDFVLRSTTGDVLASNTGVLDCTRSNLRIVAGCNAPEPRLWSESRPVHESDITLRDGTTRAHPPSRHAIRLDAVMMLPPRLLHCPPRGNGRAAMLRTTGEIGQGRTDSIRYLGSDFALAPHRADSRCGQHSSPLTKFITAFISARS